MTVIFRVEMLIVAIVFFVFIIRLINKGSLSLNRATSLFILSVSLILFPLFPAIPEYLTKLFGFETVSNFLYFCAIIFLIVLSVLQSITLSNQEEKIKNLIQEVSMIKSKKDKE